MQPIYDKPKGKPKPEQKRKNANEVELAPLGKRLVASLIDGIILAIVGSLLVFGANDPGGLVSLAVGAAYHWYFLTAEKGQTPGKRIMHIRVIKVDGTRIRDKDALVRYLGYYVGAICMMLGFIWAAFDPYNQAWHDKFAHTYVIMAD